MSTGNFNLRAIISAVDRLTPVLNAQSRAIRGWSRTFKKAGAGAGTMAAGLGAALLIPARAFMENEDAAIQLKNTLMKSNGVAEGFDSVMAVVSKLGNKLPGTTADFASMASKLKSLGVGTDTLVNGALESTAYLSVVGAKLGVTYDSAAEAIGKLSGAFNIADRDLVPFADTLQRALHLGIELTDMQEAMAQVAGPLKIVGQQGLQAANDLVPLIAILNKSGIQGSEAGTGLKKLISVLTIKGKFTTIPKMVQDLERLQKTNPAKLTAMFKDLFGEEHASKAAVITFGNYAGMLQKFQQQASLQQRINNSLGTLTNLWDAATGTFTNAMVAFAEAYAPELKQLADMINRVSENLGAWARENGPSIKLFIEMAGSLVGLKLALYGVGLALGFIAKMIAVNPFMFIAQMLALAAPLIIKHWDDITKFFRDAFSGAIEFIMNKWTSFSSFFTNGIQNVASFIKNIGDNFVSNFARATGQDNKISSTRQNILQSQTVRGGIDVNFHNAPAGMRVAPAQTQGPLTVTPNVGYRSFATGMP